MPQDPLQPGAPGLDLLHPHGRLPREIRSFPRSSRPATSEVYVEAGTLLGYQGNFSGDPNNPVGVHLHFSIVLDDGQGKFRNELEKRNTLDPSPYFGMSLNADTSRGEAPVCPEEAG